MALTSSQATTAPSADEGDEHLPAQQPDQPSLRATNQLSPILSRLQIASGIPLRQLGLRVQVSASYLSRVLSGEKFPTWELTEKIALVLGADTDAVRKVWQDERLLRQKNETRAPHSPEHCAPSTSARPAPPPTASPSQPATSSAPTTSAACSTVRRPEAGRR
ncbi:helix-turn-helix domain-containing protein [Streptomyces pseudogriseolus]|uniref:helix-turn-helix domain-containing protein n=1 Tax=Streptomyces pseudogriseolus TaxID=36817 RepID=UPI003FA29F82